MSADRGSQGALPTAAAQALHQHRQLADELHQKADDSVEVNGVGEHPTDPKPLTSCALQRENVRRLLHSYKYQGVVIGLVVLDCVCVIAELLIDLDLSADETGNTVKEVLHNISIAILSVFLVEILVKLWVYRLELLRMPWELFDAAVVVVSFALDVAFRHSVGPINGAGLIILLRLWRVTRIVSGMVLSVRRHAEHSLETERDCRRKVQGELAALEVHCAALEAALGQHGLPVPARPAAGPAVSPRRGNRAASAKSRQTPTSAAPRTCT